MAQVQLGEKLLEVNEHGFLADPGQWDEGVALALAQTEGVPELTAAHWTLVNYMRAHYLQHNIAPMIRKLCRATGVPLKRIYELFPSGPAQGICKIAGLPTPAGCV